MDEAWYGIHAKPRQEQIALLNLERQHYTCFLPMARTRKRRHGELTLIDEPLFPRYLFIHLEIGIHDFGPIRSTRGVAQLVRFAGIPARVPSDFISFLKRKQEREIQRATVTLQANPGDRVRVVTGMLAGYEGIFEKTSGNDRARVLLEMSDKYTRVQIELESLDKIA